MITTEIYRGEFRREEGRKEMQIVAQQHNLNTSLHYAQI